MRDLLQITVPKNQPQKLLVDSVVVAELELECVVVFVLGTDLVFAAAAAAALVHGSE